MGWESEGDSRGERWGKAIQSRRVLKRQMMNFGGKMVAESKAILAGKKVRGRSSSSLLLWLCFNRKAAMRASVHSSSL